ncbi:alanine racemase [Pseudonocardia sp. CA-107938]|uniref:alanine racemase n=1 Tax=Pseudonocardia sp. CA-107938 TaxID=3240021 RepID=UPI003D8C2DCD
MLDERLGIEKSLPGAAVGATVAEFLATRPRLSAFGTPLLELSGPVLDANVARLADWCRDRGLALAPHGKTTMAPALWQRQLAAGAWGITVATWSQARVAVTAGVRRVLVANAVVDPVGLAWLRGALDADAELQVLVWADSPATVAATAAGLGAGRPLDVLVELGADGGRTGARDQATALAVAAAIEASPVLQLAGVTGYEGSLAHGTAPDDLARIAAYLHELAELHRAIGGSVVSAGGSTFFDQVADVLGPLAGDGVEVVLRSGAYIVHDDGFYRQVSPFSRAGDPLESAMHVWARVISRPEPGLALLDAGKRDVSFDEGLPEPQLAAPALGAPARPITGEISAVADQHAFLRLDAADPLAVGDVVRLGLSHPCTALDKWRWIPVTDGTGADPAVTDLVRTWF